MQYLSKWHCLTDNSGMVRPIYPWEARSDENGYTIYYHSTKSGQWEDELYVKPFKDEKNNKLLFYITEVNGEKLDFDPSFGYLMGRFLEILIVHFSVNYSRIEIS